MLLSTRGGLSPEFILYLGAAVESTVIGWTSVSSLPGTAGRFMGSYFSRNPSPPFVASLAAISPYFPDVKLLVPSLKLVFNCAIDFPRRPVPKTLAFVPPGLPTSVGSGAELSNV